MYIIVSCEEPNPSISLLAVNDSNSNSSLSFSNVSLYISCTFLLSGFSSDICSKSCSPTANK